MAEMTDASKEINEVFQSVIENNPILREMFTTAHAMRGPKGEVIEFDLKRGQHTYVYFESPRGEMFCYTPWKSTLGWYYAYTMQPYGKGSQSGDPTRWRARKIVRFRKRKAAKRTAVKRLIKAGGDKYGGWQQWLDGKGE